MTIQIFEIDRIWGSYPDNIKGNEFSGIALYPLYENYMTLYDVHNSDVDVCMWYRAIVNQLWAKLYWRINKICFFEPAANFTVGWEHHPLPPV